jgi:hypothetical protein
MMKERGSFVEVAGVAVHVEFLSLFDENVTARRKGFVTHHVTDAADLAVITNGASSNGSKPRQNR